MDILSIAYSLTLFLMPIVGYLVLCDKDKRSRYNQSTWTYYLKYWLAIKSLKPYLRSCKEYQKYELFIDKPECQASLKDMEDNEFSIYGSDQCGNSLYIKFTYVNGKMNSKLVQTILFLRLNNGDLYHLPSESFSYAETSSLQKGEWKSRGLTISMLEPLKRYRILYNGFIKKMADSGETLFEHLRFNFIWHCANEPMFHPSDFDAGLMATTLAREPWRNGNWMSQVKDRPAYEQFGSMHGIVKGSGIPTEIQLNFASYRKICWADPSNNLYCFRDVNIFVAVEDGTLINAGARGFYNGGCSMLQIGTVLYSNTEVYSIKDIDLNLDQLGDNEIMPKIFTLHIKTDNSSIKCVLHVNTDKQTQSKCLETAGFHLYTATAECDVNSKQGKALMTFWYHQKNILGDFSDVPKHLPIEKEDGSIPKFVVSLDSEESKILSITGGKGKSLALLTSMKNEKFTVPEGFVVTSHAFREHINNNPELKASINSIELTSSQNIVELTNVCTKTMALFESVPIDIQTSKDIREELGRTSAKIASTSNIRWAVRSSGIGEDSEELSAAGQNSTFLGCTNEADILKAISACWGSLFSFQSVQYRKQHGIKINCDMGVVVQIMVDSECAGVLFTCHPNDGNPAEMVITSNYGLGESVVSGQSEPDTIILNRTYDGKISMKESTVGQKSEHILMSATGDGTKTEKVDASLAKQLSLTEKQSILLGEVGVELEREFGNPRDIEWAFYQDKLYLLQSRPVTTLANWTDEELLHEFDAPIFCEDDVYTRANTGEVLPGAATALTGSIISSILNQGVVQVLGGFYSQFKSNAIALFSNRFFLNVYNLMLFMPPDKIDIATKATDLTVYGHEATTQEMLEVAKERHGVTKGLKTALMFWGFFKKAWYMDATVKQTQEWGTFTIGFRNGMPLKNMLEAITDFKEVTFDVSTAHSMASQTSSVYEMILLLTLAEKATDFNDEHYTDIALLLSSCTDVVSAEIPARFGEIATVIRKSDKCQEFIHLEPCEGVNWLKENNPEAFRMFNDFMEVHGHRSFREFELKEKSWALQPEVIIKMIQTNSKVDNVTKKQQPLTADETISQLKSPKSTITKKILKFFLTKCRKAVANREKTKSELVRVINKMRIAYRQLSARLVADGYLPNEDLLFHFTDYELGRLIETRDPVLVSKAIRRQRLFPQWDKLSFPEISTGYPVADVAKSSDFLIECDSDGVALKGTPVCSGEVIARACQIRSLDDIDVIRPGDILITHCTDIGWSPYFPMLGGVVTELGGLISHGAVVAREYGLPCLVGVQQATEYFKTGDTVLLSTKTGVLKLVKREPEEKIE